MDVKEIFGETHDEVLKQLKENGFVLFEKKTGEWIPRETFNEDRKKLMDQVEDLKTQLDKRDADLGELKKQAEAGGDAEKAIADLQAKSKEQAEQDETQLSETKVDHAVEMALISAGCEDPEYAALLKTKIAKKSIVINATGDGFVGIDDQVKALKDGKFSKFFGKETIDGKLPDGAENQDQEKAVKNPFMPEHRSLFEQSKMKKEDPKLWSRFRKEAGLPV